MAVFTVYEPPNAPADRLARAEQLVFVKDRFTWLAALFPAFWLLFKRLWLEFVAFIAFVALVSWGLPELGYPPMVPVMVLLAVQILLGFEAGDIQGAALRRRGWQLAGSVSGRSRAECERRFFRVWLAEQPATRVDTTPKPKDSTPVAARESEPVAPPAKGALWPVKSVIPRWRVGSGAKA